MNVCAVATDNFRPLVAPVRKLAVAPLFPRRAALLQPGERTHTALHMRRSTAACGASRAGSLLSHPPLPAPASRAAHPTKCAGLCGAHTQRPARSSPGGRGGTTTATARARRAVTDEGGFLLATPPSVHTRPSQLHMAHPAPHMAATETRATPRQPRRPHRAWPAHPGGCLRPCTDSHPLPAHGSNAPFRVGSAPPSERGGSCALRAPTSPPACNAPQNTALVGPQDPRAPSHDPFRRAARPSGAAASHLRSEPRHALHNPSHKGLQRHAHRTCSAAALATPPPVRSARAAPTGLTPERHTGRC